LAAKSAKRSSARIWSRFFKSIVDCELLGSSYLFEIEANAGFLLACSISHFEEEDEYCPHCDNKYIVEAKTPQMAISVEGHDERMGER
jgi:hypothetical protein